MVERVTATGHLGRKGSGRPILERTVEDRAAAKSHTQQNEDAPCGDLVKETRLERTMEQRVLKQDLGIKLLRQLTVQRE